MKRRWSLLLVVALTAGCSSPAGPDPAPLESPSIATASPSVLCDRTRFDLSNETAAITATRAAHPEFTDDLAAFAASLVPDEAFALSGLTVTVDRSVVDTMVILIRPGSMTVRPDADVAPANFAALMMMELTDNVVKAGGANAATSRAAANTVAVDTYIKLVTGRPELGHGQHLRGRFSVGDVIDRLNGRDAYTRPALKKELFAANPDYLAMLVSYFKPEYYHPDTTYPDDFDTTIPLPKDHAAALAGELTRCNVIR